MPTYKTPGVHIEEISKFPPSVAAVETAIPAFIGYPQKAVDAKGDALPDNSVTRITSLKEYETFFGTADNEKFDVEVHQYKNGATGPIFDTQVKFNGTPPTEPKFLLYYAMQMFFANGGGPCYIVNLKSWNGTGALPKADFIAAIKKLEEWDEPTLYVFPDACKANADADVKDVINAALASCAKMQDRFTIADVRNAVPGGTDSNAKVTTNFRTITSDPGETKYGAGYFPYLRTSLQLLTSDGDITVKVHKIHNIADGSSADGNAKNKKLDHNDIKVDQTAVYYAAKGFVQGNGLATLPPSGAVAGIYAKVDKRRGVWKAPANVSLALVNGPAIQVTNDDNDGLNVDPTSGKSVNVIRSFVGKGTLVWGARTFAGNDNEWRYVSVRRFFNMVEESVKKATGVFVFEPNDANTWVKVRTMIENFLFLQWRDGALVGAKPEHAYYVHVGINQTMTAMDILNGYMIVEIGMAVVRPAEFIVLRFSHKMQES